MLGARVLGGLLYRAFRQIMGRAPNAGFFILADLTQTHVARRIPDAHAGDGHQIQQGGDRERQ